MANSLKSGVARGMAMCMLAGTLTFVACTKHPNAEQLRALEETKQAALAAEDQLAQKKRERDNLQRQVEQKKAELQKAQSEKQTVSTRLGAGN